MTDVLLTYFAIINLMTLILSVTDKALAVRGMRRVPEQHLLMLAWAGGAFGVKLVRLFSRHKKLKYDSNISLNLILLFQVSAALAIWSYQFTSDLQDENMTMLESWMGKDEKAARPTRFGPGSQ